MLRDGIISEEVFIDLAAEIDQAQTDSQIDWLEATHHTDPKTITELMVIVIQEEDINQAVETLESFNIPIERLPSAGEFLSRRNATLLIGIHQDNKEQVIKLLQESVKERVAVWEPKDIETPTQPSLAEVTIGATLFSFDIERYEEF